MQSTQPKKKVKLNKFEKLKAEKDGLDIKDQLEHFAEIGWQAMDKSDLELRLKWVGIFYRPLTPGKFMLRLRMPNGILTSEQMRVLGHIVQRYGEDGNADITTRQNLQLSYVNRLLSIIEPKSLYDNISKTSAHYSLNWLKNNLNKNTGDLASRQHKDYLLYLINNSLENKFSMFFFINIYIRI